MSSKPISILLDPKLSIEDVRAALGCSTLEIESTSFPSLFVLKATDIGPSDPAPRALRLVG
jgi:hypothetical protein